MTLINGWDLHRAVGGTAAFSSGHGWDVYPEPGNSLTGKKKAIRSFDELMRVTKVKRWAVSNVSHVWVPLSTAERAKDLGLEWRRSKKNAEGRYVDLPKGTKVTFTEGRPCEIWVMGDFHSNICGRLAVGDGRSGYNVNGPIVPMCKIHLGHVARREAIQERRAQESEVRREERQRERESEAAAEEMAQRVIEVLKELDVARADALVGTNGNGRVTLTTDAAEALCKAVQSWDA